MRGKLLFLVLAAGLVACGGDETTPNGAQAGKAASAPAETSWEQLLPAEAHGLIYIRSFDDLRKVMKELGHAVSYLNSVDPVAVLAMQSGFDPEQIDRTRPAAIAIALPAKGAMPMPTLILPAKDATALATSYQMGTAVARGGYVGLSLEPGYAPTGNGKLTGGLPDGDIVLRLDLEKIVAQFRPQIDAQLAQAQMLGTAVPNARKLFGGIFLWAGQAVDSAETLDLVANLDGDQLGLDVAYTAREGSPLAGKAEAPTVGELAALLPEEMPLQMLLTLDLGEWMDLFDTVASEIADALPEAERAKYRSEMEEVKTAVKDLGHDWAVGFDLGAKGIRMVCAGRARDPKAYVEKYVGFVRGSALKQMGVTARDEGEREVDGIKVRRLRFQVDAEKYAAVSGLHAESVRLMADALMGKDGLVADLAVIDDRVICCVDGSGALVAQVLLAKRVSPALRTAMDRAGGNPSFLARVELRQFLRSFAAMAHAQGGKPPAVPEGGPVPITAFGARTGRVYRWGLSLDLEQTSILAKLFR